MRDVAAEGVAGLVPVPAADSNKYSRGMCELVAGDACFPGAAVLACRAASRMGAGYVKVYTSEQAAAALHVALPSAVTASFDAFSAASHEQRPGHPCAVVVGCGFAAGEESRALTLGVLRASKAPALVDGGGISALCSPEGLAAVRGRSAAGVPTVLTPHGGEAARLLSFLDAASEEVAPVSREGQFDPGALSPPEQAFALSRAFGAACVLKGPDTFLAFGDEACADDVLAMRHGTAALSKAGTGDVLAGMVGSLLAQGLPVRDACLMGTFVHAEAGRLASADVGALCVTAEDVVAKIPAAVARVAQRGAC